MMNAVLDGLDAYTPQPYAATRERFCRITGRTAAEADRFAARFARAYHPEAPSEAARAYALDLALAVTGEP